MMIRHWIIASGTVLPLALALGAAACGDSSGTGSTGSGGAGGAKNVPCNDNPFECPAGQTCWPDAKIDAFQCLNSGQGQVGDSCQLIGGQVACADGLICVGTSQKNGVCTPYCDPKNPAHACPNGEMCRTIEITSTAFSFQACDPGLSGSTTSSSASSSSTSSSSTSTSATSTSTTGVTTSSTTVSGSSSDASSSDSSSSTGA